MVPLYQNGQKTTRRICFICPNSSFKIDKGYDRLTQHAKTKQHIINLWKFNLNPGQTLLSISSVPSGSIADLPPQTSPCELTVLQSSTTTAVSSTSSNQIKNNITLFIYQRQLL